MCKFYEVWKSFYTVKHDGLLGGRRMPTAGAQEIVTKQTREIAKVNEDQFLPSLKKVYTADF